MRVCMCVCVPSLILKTTRSRVRCSYSVFTTAFSGRIKSIRTSLTSLLSFMTQNSKCGAHQVLFQHDSLSEGFSQHRVNAQRDEEGAEHRHGEVLWEQRIDCLRLLGRRETHFFYKRVTRDSRGVFFGKFCTPVAVSVRDLCDHT